MKKLIPIIVLTVLVLTPMMGSINISPTDVAALAILGTWVVLIMNFSCWLARYFMHTIWLIISSAIIITTVSLLVYIFFFLDHTIKHGVAHDADFVTNSVYISLLLLPFATCIFVFQLLTRGNINQARAQCISANWTIITGALAPFLMFVVGCIYAGAGL